MEKITLKNEELEVVVSDFGATIISIITKDKFNNFVDVVLGYDELEKYQTSDGYLGALVGRVCNRIKEGEFTLNDVDYSLAINNGPNHLHGGIKGFSYQTFDIVERTESLVRMRYFSCDLEEGYPGNLTLDVTYSIVGSSLNIQYDATSDQDTLINITNHSYFNLSNEDTICNHLLKIDSDYMVEANSDGLATGKLIDVTNKPYDFRTSRIINESLISDDKNIQLGNGLDHPFVFNSSSNQVVLYSPSSGIEMIVSTDLPQAQIYSANYLDGRLGKGTKRYDKHAGVCIETQNMPDAIHLEKNPSTILRKGERYLSNTSFIFKVK